MPQNYFANWDSAETGQPGAAPPVHSSPSTPVRPSTRRRSFGSMPNLRVVVPEGSVDAVRDYSVGYGKQVFWGIVAAAKKWQADDAGAMAAGVAYYLALSLFPMLLLLTAGLGLVFRFTSVGHDAELQILEVVGEHCSATLSQQVREVLSQLREHSVVSGRLAWSRPSWPQSVCFINSNARSIVSGSANPKKM